MARKAKADTRSVMLAPNSLIPFDDPRIPYPHVLSSFKMDGNRCFIRHDGAILTRSLIPQPNKNLPEFLGLLVVYAQEEGVCFDGELLIHGATHHGVHGSVFNSHDKPIPEGATFNVFDMLTADEWRDPLGARALDARVKAYHDAVRHIRKTCGKDAAHIIAVEQRRMESPKHAEADFANALELGHEGVMLRNATGGYKQGRCGHRNAWLLKFKAETTYDGQIVEVMQQLKMKPGIERQRNEFGRLVQPTKNSDNYEPTDCCAGFKVRMEDGTEGEVTFAEGVADMAQRRQWWKERKSLIGKTIEFKAYPGAKDSIRSGRMIRFRPDKDKRSRR